MSTNMIEITIKMENAHIIYHIMKLAVVIKLFWNKYVQKILFKLNDVHIMLGMLIQTVLKKRNSRFYENFYSKNCRM